MSNSEWGFDEDLAYFLDEQLDGLIENIAATTATPEAAQQLAERAIAGVLERLRGVSWKEKRQELREELVGKDQHVLKGVWWKNLIEGRFTHHRDSSRAGFLQEHHDNGCCRAADWRTEWELVG
jgi:hypothetical protein